MAPLTGPVRVMVTDDSAFMRRAISQMFERAGDFNVVGTARDGLDAIEQAKKLQPDLVTMDIEMPRMDGLTALRQVRRVCDAAVLMVSSLTVEGSTASLAALRAGAADVIAKDMSQVSLDISRIEADLIGKARAIAGHRRHRATTPVHELPPVSRPPTLKLTDFDVIVIGSSTGGPPVLETILAALPDTTPVPLVIAQHMPALFTKAMSERLDSLSRLTVLHAEHNMPLLPGHAYVGPGGQHVRVTGNRMVRLRLEVSPNPADALYKPCVNELFASAAKACGPRTLAVVLTGMGEDGCEGGRKLHDAGGQIIAQDHGSCVVYGMPKAVTQAGLVIASLNPEQIAATLSGAPTAGDPTPPANTLPVRAGRVA